MQDMPLLNALAMRIGTDTQLGAWLASPGAQPVVLALAGLLILVLLVLLVRRLVLGRTAADHPEAEAQEPETPRLHPEALATLYEHGVRREPRLSGTGAADAEAPVVPAVTPAVVPAGKVVVPEARSVSQAHAQVGDSFRLLVPAVDRLLRRVESQQAQINALLEELKLQSAAVLVQGERILALEAERTRSPEPVQIPQHDSVDGQSADMPVAADALATFDGLLDQAIVLAASGIGERELAERLGLSVAEARLVCLAHGPEESSSAAGAVSGPVAG